jgi:hypothetical protein
MESLLYLIDVRTTKPDAKNATPKDIICWRIKGENAFFPSCDAGYFEATANHGRDQHI